MVRRALPVPSVRRVLSVETSVATEATLAGFASGGLGPGPPHPQAFPTSAATRVARRVVYLDLPRSGVAVAAGCFHSVDPSLREGCGR